MMRSAAPVSASAPRRCVMAQRPPQLRRASVTVQAVAGTVGKPVEKLKRAPSPFNLFYAAKFGAVKADLKGKGKEGTLAECAKVLREHWDKLPETQKQPFVAQAEKVKAEFEKAKAEGRVEGKKPKKEDPAGPKPMPVYAAFLKQQFPALKAKHPTKSAAELAKLIAEQWKSFDAAKKAQMKANYDKEMQAYQARKAQLGVTVPTKATPAAAAPAKPAAAKAAPPAPAAALKRASPTPAQQPPAAAKPTTSPARGATPKRTSPTK